MPRRPTVDAHQGHPTIRRFGVDILQFGAFESESSRCAALVGIGEGSPEGQPERSRPPIPGIDDCRAGVVHRVDRLFDVGVATGAAAAEISNLPIATTKIARPAATSAEGRPPQPKKGAETSRHGREHQAEDGYIAIDVEQQQVPRRFDGVRQGGDGEFA